MVVTRISEIGDSVKRLAAFIREREAIRVKKEMTHKPPPWTTDPILGGYRFCNVRRENDKVTRWISDNWRQLNNSDPDLWFAMCLARLHNLPSTLQAIGYPHKWSEQRYLKAMAVLKINSEKIFNGAYIVSTQGKSMEKTSYLAQHVLTPLWNARKRLRPKQGDTLNSYHMVLGQMEGFGSFMTAQVIADLRYYKPLSCAADIDTFAASGPGSRRGLNFVFGRDPASPWREDEWRTAAERLRQEVNVKLQGNIGPLHGQDFQNCLCEFSKYSRACSTGQMPKQKYVPALAFPKTCDRKGS